MSDPLQLVVALICSAFFSGMEIAFLSASRLQLEVDSKRAGKKGRVIAQFTSSPNRFIGSMLMGNTLALVWVGMVAARIMDPWLSPYMGETMVLVVETLLSTTVVLFVAEYPPKVFFRSRSNAAIQSMAWVLKLVMLVLWPLVTVLTALSAFILRRMGQDVDALSRPHVFSKSDLDHFLEEGASGPENEPEVELFKNALEFDECKVRACAVPRTEIEAVSDDISLEELKDAFMSTGFSKLLVYKDSIDDAYAYVHAFGLFKRPSSLKALLTPLTFMPETLSAQDAFKDLIREKRSMALVIDEHGSPSGMVTLEDIIEEIFGEIDDEHDKTEVLDEEISPGIWRLDGALSIDEVNERLGFDWVEDESYTTVGGFVGHHLGRLPALDDLLIVDGWRIEIHAMGAQRIATVTASKNKV